MVLTLLIYVNSGLKKPIKITIATHQRRRSYTQFTRMNDLYAHNAIDLCWSEGNVNDYIHHYRIAGVCVLQNSPYFLFKLRKKKSLSHPRGKKCPEIGERIEVVYSIFDLLFQKLRHSILTLTLTQCKKVAEIQHCFNVWRFSTTYTNTRCVRCLMCIYIIQISTASTAYTHHRNLSLQ